MLDFAARFYGLYGHLQIFFVEVFEVVMNVLCLVPCNE